MKTLKLITKEERYMPRSILDTDLYKLTMQMAVLKLYSEARVRYQFINRGGTKFPKGFGDRLREKVEEFSKLRLTKEEETFLKDKTFYLPQEYINFLKAYRFDPAEVDIRIGESGLSVVVEGLWYKTILWETPLMSAISELYYELSGLKKEAYSLEKRKSINAEKAKLFRENGILFAEFGTRRRYSFLNQALFLENMKEGTPKQLIGTSNVYLAMLYGLDPIGTMAHEWIQAHAAMFGFKDANCMAMERWRAIFGDNLNIALTDTFGSQDFFKNFGFELANKYKGTRQDSGNPLAFLEKMLTHYKNLGIDATKKVLVFSDSLKAQDAVNIHKVVAGRIVDLYGIGTSLTNDVGLTPLNIVIKMVGFKPGKNSKWIPTVKLSDVKGKHTGDPVAIERCKKELELLK